MLHDFSQWLHTTAWATAIRESELVFPLLLIVHVLGLVLLLAAGVNAWLFHRLVEPRLVGWTTASALPFGARVVGGVSLLNWAVLVVVSRYIPLADSHG